MALAIRLFVTCLWMALAVLVLALAARWYHLYRVGTLDQTELWAKLRTLLMPLFVLLVVAVTLFSSGWD